MSKIATVLIIEDEKPIRQFIRVSLESQGYKCIEAENGELSVSLAASHQPQIIILDLGLPDIDGLEVIDRMKEWSKACIIVVSARGHDREKVAALDAGAEDYLTKPFSVPELLARIRVALRRKNKSFSTGEEPSDSFKIGELEITYSKRKVCVNEEEIHLTPFEYDIVVLLSKHAGKVLTHKFILENVWGIYSGKDTQSLRVFMANIRRKIEKNHIEPRYILTEVGVGYRMVDE